MKRTKTLRRRAIVTAAIALCTGAQTYASAADTKTVNGVMLNKSILLMKSGDLDTLTATLLPTGTQGDVRWYSDDTSIATVSGGIVTAVSNGTATVAAETADGTYKAACTINVSDEGADARSGMPGMGGGNMPPRGGQGGPGGPGQGENAPGMGQGGQGGMPPTGGQGFERGQGGQGGPGQGGMPGGRRPGGGGNQSDDSDATDANAYVLTEGEASITDATYSSSTTDANAVKVSGGTLTITDCTLTKAGGDSSNPDGSSFYGTNAGVLARKGGKAIITGGSISTDAVGANGIVAYGGEVEVSGTTINCKNRLSRGIHATGGGTITARDLTINTQERNSSVIALDRGGGTVTVIGGTYNCAGEDCAVMYSTGDLTVNNITGSSEKGEIGVIEGNNIIAINNSDLTSHATAASRGLMILQSGSGDAGEGLNGIITVAGGSLTMTDSGASLIEIVTNVTGKVTLDGVKTTIPSGILMTVDYNKRWRTYGATGVLILSGSGTTYEGSVVADEYSMAEVTVNSGVEWKGAYDKDDTAKSTSLTLNGGTWTLTADSHVDNITLNGNAVINKNGHTLACDNINNVSGTVND